MFKLSKKEDLNESYLYESMSKVLESYEIPFTPDRVKGITKSFIAAVGLYFQSNPYVSVRVGDLLIERANQISKNVFSIRSINKSATVKESLISTLESSTPREELRNFLSSYYEDLRENSKKKESEVQNDLKGT